MCGICGIYNPEGTPLNKELTGPVLKGMIKSLRHRGPDETGSFHNGPVALGHSRLSIIDLASGRQPMDNEDGSIWIVFNGEIFNYLELRDELESRGHIFKTKSDTEVLVHLYEESGEQMVHRLNGQFAFAIYNLRDNSLFLARDHFGICPLFYTGQPGLFLFASEIKAFTCFPGMDFSIDPKALAQVFTFWSIVSPRTPFRRISSLPPGSCMRVKPGSSTPPSPRTYWQLDFPRHGEEERAYDQKYWARKTEEALVNAVRLRLRADVPVGAYLSGGLDSSIISTIVKRLTSTPVEAFSLAFAQASYDESDFQEKLASAIGVRYNVVRISNPRIGRIFPRVIRHAERPILRSAPAPMYLLSSLVKSHGFKVVLTGEGADELFGGYDIFKEDKIRRFWARAPESSCRPLLLNRLYPYSPLTASRAGRMLYAFYRKDLTPTDIFAYSHRPTWANTRPIMTYLDREVYESIRHYDPVEELEEVVPEDFGKWHPLHQAQFLETRLLLSEYLLCSQGERMTMGNSVEGRYPFLDPGVAGLASQIPPEFKLRGLKEKYILRQAFEHLLPEEIANRPKRPYQAPNKECFLDHPDVSGIYDILEPERLSEAGLFDPGKVGRLLKKCAGDKVSGFRDNAACMGILSTQILWEIFVKQQSSFL